MLKKQTSKLKSEKQVAPQQGGMQTLESNSKIIGVVCATFGGTSTKQVLDFSSIKQENVDFFSQFSCYYQVLDFHKAFKALPSGEIDKELSEAYYDTLLSGFDKQLRASGNHQYDVIFLWDILNYLDVEQASKLFAMIKEHCHWKTHVYCMINTNPIIPKQQMSSYVVDHNTLGYKLDSRETKTTKNPNHFKSGLSRVSGGYKLEYSSLLKSGIQEMLFSLRRDV